ncbi:MAG: hypothetical protein KGK01_04270 [Bradyrhizobium sp.]|uniref:hypothetical protein n=1 Tax=Bradyrhizobium sp. TaxID=376 RepID=UPI002381E912|nr:hypothetical protein [Bradyrhizobium sp.]MDE2068863.1 hypothetical protein [Bradyrhizobium sp.]MDE2241673.1 hypothetical protein [Bradyrhizobium sp.]MDE2470411.1 hypothetical protein [Bradyrhizobium sp.]
MSTTRRAARTANLVDFPPDYPNANRYQNTDFFRGALFAPRQQRGTDGSSDKDMGLVVNACARWPPILNWPGKCRLMAGSTEHLKCHCPTISRSEVKDNILEIVVRSSFLIDDRKISFQIKRGTTIQEIRFGNAESTSSEGLAESPYGSRESDNRRMFWIEE